MIMKKLNAQEIIEILKKNTTVEKFCDEDYFLEIPEDFKFSKETQDKIDNYKEGVKKYEETKDWNYRTNNPYPYKEIHEEYATHLGLGEIEEVDSYGGEDCGSTYYSIKHFIDHDIYLRADGWYQSHYGVDFEDWDYAVREVKPKIKTITVFE